MDTIVCRDKCLVTHKELFLKSSLNKQWEIISEDKKFDTLTRKVVKNATLLADVGGHWLSKLFDKILQEVGHRQKTQWLCFSVLSQHLLSNTWGIWHVYYSDLRVSWDVVMCCGNPSYMILLSLREDVHWEIVALPGLLSFFPFVKCCHRLCDICVKKMERDRKLIVWWFYYSVVTIALMRCRY